MLLRRTHLHPLVTFSLSLGLLLTACTVTSTDDDATSGVGGTGNVSSVSSTGDTGGIGVGGEGAVGPGVGGGGAGTGGSASCVGENGTGQTDADCDKGGLLPIAAGTPVCGDTGTEPPPGVAVCHQSFKIYTPGSAENMFDCLAQIPVAPTSTACDLNEVQKCVTKVHTEACDVAEVQMACSDLKAACIAAGDMSLDESKCNFFLRPFNATALADIQACEEASMQGDCQTTLETCWDQVATVQ